MSRAVMRHTTSWVLVLGLVVLVARVAVAWATPGHGFDMRTFGEWGLVLRDHPLGTFYQQAGSSADHLPGDLYLHHALAQVCSVLGVEPGSRPYVLALKTVATLADMVVAGLSALLVHRYTADRRAAAGAALVVWAAPAWVLLSADWGQWDSVSVALLLGGVALLGTRAWLVAPVLLAWACLVKPQLGLAAIACCLAWATAGRLREAGWRLLVLAGVGAASVLALCGPFDTGLTQLGARWSLTERMAYASDLYRYTTLGAANVWQLRPGEDDVLLVGVPLRTLGHVGLAVCLLVLGVRWWRLRTRTTWIAGGTWLAAMAMWAFYLCETRCHERYLVPAAALLVLHAGLTRWHPREGLLAGGVVAVLSGSLAVHLQHGLPGVTGATHDRLLAAVNCALFLVALVASRPAEPLVGAAPRTHEGAEGPVEPPTHTQPVAA